MRLCADWRRYAHHHRLQARKGRPCRLAKTSERHSSFRLNLQISAKKKFKKIKAAAYNREIKQLKKNELWDDEMLRT